MTEDSKQSAIRIHADDFILKITNLLYFHRCETYMGFWGFGVWGFGFASALSEISQDWM